MKVGDIVDYHSEIGSEITSRMHVIGVIAELKSGEKVAWITGKSACVALAALTKAEDDIPDEVYMNGYNGDEL